MLIFYVYIRCYPFFIVSHFFLFVCGHTDNFNDKIKDQHTKVNSPNLQLSFSLHLSFSGLIPPRHTPLPPYIHSYIRRTGIGIGAHRLSMPLSSDFGVHILVFHSLSVLGLTDPPRTEYTFKTRLTVYDWSSFPYQYTDSRVQDLSVSRLILGLKR